MQIRSTVHSVPKGKIVSLDHRSTVLLGNPWNDPVDRPLHAYLPPSYQQSSELFPSIWCLASFTSSGPAQIAWKGFGENLAQRLDRLIATGKLGQVVILLPDCFTSLGGNQYVNSPSLGPYADYIHQELIPFAESELRIVSSPKHRAVFGKSSGGYGALLFAAKYASYWNAVASHSGDVGFECLYKTDFPNVACNLQRFKGDIKSFLDYFWDEKNKPNSDDFHTLMCLAMAASYDPDDSKLGFSLPFDLETCEIIDEKWNRWLKHDPLSWIKNGTSNLNSLAGLYFDCGNRDQYHIQFGSRRLSRELRNLSVDHTYLEYDGTHSATDHRLDISLPYLYQHIK